MKRIILTVALMVCLLMPTACKEGEPTPPPAETVTMPIAGFCGYDNGIVIKTDYYAFATQESVLAEEAYAQDGKDWVKLEKFETTFHLKRDVTTYYEELTVPITYFVYQNTARPYLSISHHDIGRHMEVRSIPNDSEHVLLTGEAVKNPLICDLSTGEYRLLTTEFESYILPLPSAFSADGRYTCVLGGDSEEVRRGSAPLYVLDRQSGEFTRIPWDSAGGYYLSPQVITDDTVFCMVNKDGDYIWYAFHISTGLLQRRDDLSFVSREYGYLLTNPYLWYRRDWQTGDLSTYHFGTKQRFSGEMMSLTGVGFHESGRYVLNARWEDGRLVHVALCDLAQNTRRELSDIIPNCREQNGSLQYKGYAVSSMQFCGENALLIAYSLNTGSSGNDLIFSEILDLSDYLEP